MDRRASRAWAARNAGLAAFVFAWIARGDVPGAGAPIRFGARPIFSLEVSACSFREPLCVHANRGTPARRVLDTLASAEQAWEVATGGLMLPAPDIDLATGAFDVYLVKDVPSGADAELGARDALASFDRASAFVILGESAGHGCARDALLARETARAILWRTAPATDAATARAETAYLARLMVPCALEDLAGIDTFQAHPEASLASLLDPPEDTPGAGDRDVDYAFGASLFYWWLDWSFGNSPGSIVRALWALAPTRTPAGAASWADHPDGFDVLRTSFKNALTTGSTLDDLLLDFAVGRAFVGSASDGDHMPETRSLGDAARVHADWEIDWPAQPRRLASARGIEPTGAAYVAIDCSSAPKGARLRIEAEWEEDAKLRWAAVKVDGAGHEKASLAIPSAQRATEAQITVVDLEDVAKVVLVGTNAGDPLYPFDPNDAAWEPHGWIVSVAAEGP